MCQHGPTECEVNMLEACAIKHLLSAMEFLPFIFCAENAVQRKLPPAAVITHCSKNATVRSSIEYCYGGGQGAEGVALVSDAGDTTRSLKHKYTPWLLINGEHSAYGEEHLQKAVCKAYSGPNPPPACRKHVDRRCFPDEPAAASTVVRENATLVAV
uniref:Gamma-interferon-inducible lysosomal thiol reductase n=1 Tax=Pyrodinium bahamense TaxID=73915 RepID=A0A7S0AG79_9DINO|mmetsp:Transcript_34029/g.94182  ORF Transcript_34029/g.94182 Transcript_34029/m.94182 type:complete len:157 (+) Transcript_34029:295-765(+)|eukprot:CAMPEP_0179101288 /NCGR_PEP_ID=MMETSP0796-20121207/46823_1 /TAXON_ID=73915 /ORGANISM="Pyrodinium bahamense, Strain pbaha01" /LENGTH=156 /DNA_ID=CAMNT_0020799135 /DNA_START=204 /DNA_END=674 /DNA_ORIENTATION=+